MAPCAGTSDRSPAPRSRRRSRAARALPFGRLDPGRCAAGGRNRGPATARRPAHGLGRAAWRRDAAGRARRRGDQLAGAARADRPALLRARRKPSHGASRRWPRRARRRPICSTAWASRRARPVRGSRGCLRRGGLPAARCWWKPSLPAARRPSCSWSAPDRFAEIAAAICSWQERWNRATATPASVSRSRLEQELMGPAAELAGSIPDEAAYRGWLAARCSSLAGGGIPAVARHNDLTMRNVVVDDRGSVGVLDWAEAEADRASAHGLHLRGRRRGRRLRRLPTPARRAAQLLPERGIARAGGGAAPGAPARVAAALARRPRARLSRLLAAPRAATNRGAASGGERPFLEIVRWQARRAVEEVA